MSTTNIFPNLFIFAVSYANVMPLAHSTKFLVILHAKADSAAVAELGKRLAPMESNGHLRIWDGGDIPPGANREEAIQAALQGADMVAFWVSPDLWHDNDEFDFVCNTAGLIPPTAQVVPIIARHATWEALPFLKQYGSNVLPTDQQPMPSQGKEPQDAWMNDVASSVAQKLGLMEPKSVAMRPFWKRITPDGRLSAVLTVIGLLVAIVSAYLAYLALGSGNEGKLSTPNAAERRLDTGCGFPVHFVQDTLYVLITRFEDYENEGGSECYGRGIERRIDQLVQSRKMPVIFCYRDDLSPNQSREADRLRDEFHADLIIWGKLRNAGPDCKADGFCLQFNPSDTLIRYVGGEVRKPELDDFQSSIAASDIEQGLINMGAERFDDWFVGMFNLKIGKRKPELFVIDDGWGERKKLKAYFMRGGIWIGLGRYTQAITDYDRAIKISSKDPTLYTLRGIAKSKLGRHTESIIDFDQSLTIDSSLQNTYYYLGEANRYLRRSLESIKYYDKYINLSPRDPDGYIGRAEAKSDLGRYPEAIADFDIAIEIDAKNEFTFVIRGLNKMYLYSIKGAITDFDKAISINSKISTFFHARGYANYLLKNYVNAITDYNRAIEIDPKVAQLYMDRGNAKSDLGQYAKAIADYDSAITLDAKYMMAYKSRGRCKESLKHWGEAIKDYDQAIRLNPKNAEIYFLRGRAKANLFLFAESIEDYDQAIKLDSSNLTKYLFRRAYAKGELGLSAGAIQDYDEVIKLDSTDTAAYMNRGIIKDELGCFDEAIADFTKGIVIDPKNAQLYMNRGVSKRNKGQYLSFIEDRWYAIWLEPSRGWDSYLIWIFTFYFIKFKSINRFLYRLFFHFFAQKKRNPLSSSRKPTNQ